MRALIGRAGGAPELWSAQGFRVGTRVGLFDPIQVEDALAAGGRPAKEAKRLQQGAVAEFTLPGSDAARARFVAGPPEASVRGLRRRLRVASGVVAVGDPEASSGPRLGAVRVDPERTGLHDALERRAVAFFRLDPGLYAVDGCVAEPGAVVFYVYPDPKPRGQLAPVGAVVPSA